MTKKASDDCPECGLPMAFHTHPGSCRLPVEIYTDSEWQDIENILEAPDEKGPGRRGTPA